MVATNKNILTFFLHEHLWIQRQFIEITAQTKHTGDSGEVKGQEESNPKLRATQTYIEIFKN